ncbi:uncharacterized protein PGTG_11991 [Puccinia graminis f. sp. tritici CRL 75-36-700-3]|uniref:Uncharacterized protein n=1 Tax=Puccinia graminis f. sp. tritici (strain CRL 75-36-700-3 / race SCCL) TaxID=418459 RepID=E3KP10_PUCGT|nr:uncharacterized protein PGTG_11991 [Puccinia graminis f. sp. tritici CRL 75-36-700-3]EFP86035.1 hypothetical protein PGTG_11991 [Puccinia graminis f. sp. tritici CRL 75-36-700-3]
MNVSNLVPATSVQPTDWIWVWDQPRDLASSLMLKTPRYWGRFWVQGTGLEPYLSHNPITSSRQKTLMGSLNICLGGKDDEKWVFGQNTPGSLSEHSKHENLGEAMHGVISTPVDPASEKQDSLDKSMEDRVKNLIKNLKASDMEELEAVINHLQQFHNYLASSIEESEKTIKDPQNLVKSKPSEKENLFDGDYIYKNGLLSQEEMKEIEIFKPSIVVKLLKLNIDLLISTKGKDLFGSPHWVAPHIKQLIKNPELKHMQRSIKGLGEQHQSFTEYLTLKSIIANHRLLCPDGYDDYAGLISFWGLFVKERFIKDEENCLLKPSDNFKFSEDFLSKFWWLGIFLENQPKFTKEPQNKIQSLHFTITNYILQNLPKSTKKEYPVQD